MMFDAGKDGQKRGAGMKDHLAAKVAAERARLDAIKDAAAVPDECGPDIAPSPARRGFVLVRPVELLPVGTDRVEAVHRGYGGRSAIQCADVFDAMRAAAARRKKPMALTPGQISMARRYRDLVELLAADGCKLSNLDASTGSGDSGGWMDRRLQVSQEVDILRRRIGNGVALSVRRVRPSDRGAAQRGQILDRVMVDMVCLKGCSVDQVLRAHGWQTNGRGRKAVTDALSAALDRMIGYRGEKKS